MSAKVVPIAGREVKPVVELLADLLAEAKAGRLTAVAVAGITSDHYATIAISNGAPGTLVLGACELLKNRIISGIEDAE